MQALEEVPEGEWIAEIDRVAAEQAITHSLFHSSPSRQPRSWRSTR